MTKTTPIRIFLRPRLSRRTSGSFADNLPRRRHLSLAYTLYEPPVGTADPIQTPLIILHGLFGNKQNNRSTSKVLARALQRHVYAIDLRNHGDSPHDPKHDYTAMADDMDEFITHHRLRNPAVIGHSMGAKVAMTLALRSPKRISAMISVDNAPVDAMLKSDFGKYVQGMRMIEDANVTKQVEADAILKTVEKALPIRQFLLTNLIRRAGSNPLRFRIPLHTLSAALDKLGDFPFKDPEEAHFDGPALFVRGTRSHYVADETLPLIGRFFPRFELRDIDSGHWVISEQPELFNHAVIEFLSRQDM
ncbi:hypothetical protein MMC14_002466 [Varicellaria rhodocarpa]|nr:hypothetical protein [Varicellaria rhodocarpa]